jgi:hypothetical protein
MEVIPDPLKSKFDKLSRKYLNDQNWCRCGCIIGGDVLISSTASTSACDTLRDRDVMADAVPEPLIDSCRDFASIGL